MLKYVDTQVVFAEIPDEITLAISISGCPCHCKGCHSSYLAKDVGDPLTYKTLARLILANKGITCVSFMGGDSNPKEVSELAKYIKENFNVLSVAWYSGRQHLSDEIELKYFDFVKLGPYEEDKGPLNKRTTNQQFFKIVHYFNEDKCVNITSKFWKDAD